MAKFRETNWFKRGELVEEIPDTEGSNALRPIEDRYLDQGTTTRDDSQLFGIHTGMTAPIPVRASYRTLDRYPQTTHGHDPEFASVVIACDPASAPELQQMIRELKQRNRTLMAMCGAAIVVLAMFTAGLVL